MFSTNVALAILKEGVDRERKRERYIERETIYIYRERQRETDRAKERERETERAPERDIETERET